MTKIDIISGFLGAGKTTFIKKMIDEAFKGEQIVLIENEFGEVGIDGGFLKDAGIQITEMNSGCICCSLVGDFGKNLNEVITKYHPDRILIEPSGVGKLSDVMKSVIDIEKEQDVKLNALVTVVNALKASKQMKAFGEFFNNQIEYATTVILSRSQNATPEQLEFCVKQIQTLNPNAAIITTDWAAIGGEQILKVMEGQDNLEMKVLAEARHAQDEEEHEHEHHHHDHDHEEHEHHHDHDHEEHHHDHDHEEHDHHHDHDHEEHEHHHDHDHEEHEHHHEHGENCTCGCHDHDHEHHHHHHADDVFTSWGKETPHKFEKSKIEEILKGFVESDNILRSKGMVESTDGSWIYFDMVPGEYEIREGEPDYTGRIVGPVIQAASYDAILGGANLEKTFTCMQELRAEKVEIPIVFMMYYNTVLHYGVEEFVKKCHESGVDGLIIPDLPFEEQEELQNALNGADETILIQLVSPVSGARAKTILEHARGFVYCVSSMGVTGQAATFHREVIRYLSNVKAVSKIPVMMGFGIRTAEDVRPMKDIIDGAIVGSHFINLMRESDFDPKKAAEYCHTFKRELNEL